MKRRMGLTGERSRHKFAGIFESAERMQECHKQLVDRLGDAETIESLKPGSESPSWRLEPEPRGIWHTLVRAHLWLTLAGVAAAVLIFAILMMLEVAFVVQNPWPSLALLVLFCGIGGALLGGVVTMRPDHTPYIARVRAALDDERHVLVVHAKGGSNTTAVRDCLKRYADEIVTTL